MKKFRINVKRLSMTVGVLGTAMGIFAAAAWFKAPLAAFQPVGDPALLAEPSADELVAIGQAAPPPGGDPLLALDGPTDPLRALRLDPDGEPKAGKHGPTAMMAADPMAAGGPVGASQLEAGAEKAPVQPTGVLAPAHVASRVSGAGDARLVHVATPVGELAARAAGRPPLMLTAAMDPARVLRSRSAETWRPVAPIWRGIEQPRRVASVLETVAATAQVAEASWNAETRTLTVPVKGVFSRRAPLIHTLSDGRAYVDLPNTAPAFSGSRSEDVKDGPLSRWVMAAHPTPTGLPGTRVAFRLEGGAVPRIALTQGAVTISVAPAVGGARVAAAAAVAKTAGGARLGEARYDVAAGVLSIPVDGKVDATQLRLKRLDGGRVYLDVNGSRPAFSGTREAVYPGHALTKWTMAGHLTGGYPLTRIAFSLATPGNVDVRVVNGEIRLTLPGHTGIRSAPAPTSDASLAPTEPLETATSETVPQREDLD